MSWYNSIHSRLSGGTLLSLHSFFLIFSSTAAKPWTCSAPDVKMGAFPPEPANLDWSTVNLANLPETNGHVDVHYSTSAHQYLGSTARLVQDPSIDVHEGAWASSGPQLRTAMLRRLVQPDQQQGGTCNPPDLTSSDPGARCTAPQLGGHGAPSRSPRRAFSRMCPCPNGCCGQRRIRAACR